MIQIAQLTVEKESQTICRIDQFQVEAGETVAVVGANGSGKTTLLRVLAGLENTYTGQSRVDASLPQKTFVHQQPLLFRGTVLSNVTYAQRNGTRPQELLTALGIDHLASRSTLNLSGGEIRRVALARALATGPKLLLLDEPLAELDPTAADKVCQLLSTLTDTTIVIASPTTLPESIRARTYDLNLNHKNTKSTN